MEYTIKALGLLAHVSARTLRYYDEIGLLEPKRINSSGYRIYGKLEVDRLQQILFYKALGVGLSDIAKILGSEDFDDLKALKAHKEELLEKKIQIEALLLNVNQTIREKEGKTKMKDQEKFEGFIKEKIEKNENQYGQEIRKNYGNKAIDNANEQFRKMSPEQYAQFKAVEKEIIEKLKRVTLSKDIKSDDAEALAALHKKWITMAWGGYNKEAHKGLLTLYIQDERFKKYYESQAGKGSAEILKDVVILRL